MKKQLLVSSFIMIITIVLLSGLLESQIFAKTNAMKNYEKGFSDGCKDRQSGAADGPNSLLKTTAGPHGHSHSYLVGWDDGFSDINCIGP